MKRVYRLLCYINKPVDNIPAVDSHYHTVAGLSGPGLMLSSRRIS